MQLSREEQAVHRESAKVKDVQRQQEEREQQRMHREMAVLENIRRRRVKFICWLVIYYSFIQITQYK